MSQRWLGPLREWLPAVAIGYFVVAGGTDLAVTSTAFRAVNAVIGGILIALWIRRLADDNDALDRATLVALLAFLVAGVFSRHPRQSFDAAVAATAYVAAFHVARRALADTRTRANLILVLAGIGVVMAVVFATIWGRVAIEWGVLTGFQGWPPLDLPLPRGPYRHPQVVAMLLGMLAPTLVLVVRSGAIGVRVVAALGLVATLLVIFLSGSRTVWLAGVLASVPVLVYLARRRRAVAWRRIRPVHLLGGALVLVLLAGIVVQSGAADPLIRRVTDLATIGGRARIWGAALDMWRASPLTGVGPATFPIELSLVGFYETSAFTPRHADNGVIQLLAEVGLLGVTGCAVACALFVRTAAAALSGISALALGVVAFFALTSLTDNPTDTANLLVVLLAWASIAAPALTVERGDGPMRVAALAPVRMAAWGMGALVALATAATFVSAGAYDVARASVSAGDLRATSRALDVAVAFDPGMALYVRDRGIVALSLGETDAARTDLEAAARLNGADDTTWRALAITHARAERHDDAIAAATRAVELQRFEVTNTLLYSLVAARAGDEVPAADALRDVLLDAPWITASPEWGAPFPEGDELTALLEATTERWSESADPPPGDLQPAWLVGLAGRADLEAQARTDAGGLSATAAALSDAFNCRTDEAVRGLEAALATDGHARGYWTARLLVWRLAGRADIGETLRLAAARAPVSADAVLKDPGPISPLSDGNQDYRFYRREALLAIEVGVRLPSPAQGLRAWLLDPRAAAAEGAPASPLASCP